MVPMWSRARRFSNVYAFATLDVFSVVLWLSAWAAVASYVVAGKGKGKNDKASGCDNFGSGSPGKCKLSEATVVLGVVVMLLFAGTSYVSIKSLMHYRRTGMMPSAAIGNDFAAQTQDAFSSNIRTDDFEEEGDLDPRQGGRPGYGYQKHDDDDEHALLQQADAEDIAHPHAARLSGSQSPGLHETSAPDYDTSYGGAYGRHSPDPTQTTAYEGSSGVYGR